MLLYNDKDKTTGVTMPHMLHIDKFGNAVSVMIDENNFRTSEAFVPAGTLKVSDGNYIIIAHNGSTYRYGILDVKW